MTKPYNYNLPPFMQTRQPVPVKPKEKKWWQVAKDTVGSAAGAVGRAAWQALPADNLIRATQEARKGNWVGAVGNVGIAGLDTLGLFTGGTALRIAGKEALEQGTKFGAKQIINTLGKPGTVLKNADRGAPGLRLLGTAFSPGAAQIAQRAVDPVDLAGKAFNKVFYNSAPQQQTGTSRPNPAAESAADMRRFEEASKGKERIETAPNTIPMTPITPITPPAPAAPGAPGGAPAPVREVAPRLIGLSPDQIRQLAMEERALQREYDALLAGLARQEAEGRLAAGRDRAAALRQAQGRSQDLSGALAATGLSTSPAAAISAGEVTDRARIARDVNVSKTLADLISSITGEKVVAKSKLRKGKTSLRDQRRQFQIQNTMAQLAQAYAAMGGQ
jgi:hypothetical protein